MQGQTTIRWTALKKLIKEADVVIEVVDARDIKGTRLPIAEKMAGSNRLVIVANKSDLLHKGEIKKLPKNALLISAKDRSDIERKKLIMAIMARANKKAVKALLVGYPNVGKSSLINMLARRKATKVSSIAGTTKNIQWVNVDDNLKVIDFRGLFPEKEGRETLVSKGAINVEGEEEKYAHAFAEKILKNAKLRKWLEKKFDINIASAKTSEEILEIIAKRRNWYIKGGELNITEAAKILVRAMKEAPEI